MWKPRHREVSWYSQEYSASWEVTPNGLNSRLCHWVTAAVSLSQPRPPLPHPYHEKTTQWFLRSFSVLSFQDCPKYLSKVTQPQRRRSSWTPRFPDSSPSFRCLYSLIHEHPSWHLLISSSGSQPWAESESSRGLGSPQIVAIHPHPHPPVSDSIGFWFRAGLSICTCNKSQVMLILLVLVPYLGPAGV